MTENFNNQSKDDMLVKLELEKKDLERKIATPGMSAGSAVVWLILILIAANIFRLFFVTLVSGFEGYKYYDDPSTYCLMIPIAGIGLIVLALRFSQSNNKSGLEEKLKNITLEIVKQERQLGQKPETPIAKSIKKDNAATTNSDSHEVTPLGTEKLEKELRRIKKLLDDELITNEEYQDLRKKIMKSK